VHELLNPVKQIIADNLKYHIDSMGTGREGVSLLFNEGGVPEQIAHTDYGPSIDCNELTHDSDAHLGLPAIAIVTLDNDTPFNTWPGYINHRYGSGKLQYSFDLLEYDKKREVIPKLGSVLVFRGDMIHSGAKNVLQNHRLHMSINKKVTGSQFTVRTSAAGINKQRGETFSRYMGKQLGTKQQCNREPSVQYFTTPGENTTDIKTHAELVEMEPQNFKIQLVDSKDHHALTISQKFNFLPYITHLDNGLRGGQLVGKMNEGDEFTTIVRDMQKAYVLTQGSMFGPNSLLGWYSIGIRKDSKFIALEFQPNKQTGMKP